MIDKDGKEIKLAKCPCGEVPKELVIAESASSIKFAYVYGDCCDDWETEFRTDYKELDTPECMELAIQGWNDAKRG